MHEVFSRYRYNTSLSPLSIVLVGSIYMGLYSIPFILSISTSILIHGHFSWTQLATGNIFTRLTRCVTSAASLSRDASESGLVTGVPCAQDGTKRNPKVKHMQGAHDFLDVSLPGTTYPKWEWPRVKTECAVRR
jgi:hypothetical protein